MEKEFSNMNEEEQLKAENDFMKMKLMLENGAKFSTGKPGEEMEELPPGIENIFLKNVMEFEKQFENRKRIKVFDRIERPTHFLPVAEIPDDRIDEAWKELLAHMNQYGVNVEVCSPNVSKRELYRFTLEELFECEMDDINIRGMMHCFIYDEFHPDPVYDNTRTAVENCINYILEKQPMEWAYSFRDDNLRLNQHYPLNTDELLTRINNFKEQYDEIVLKKVEVLNCTVDKNESCVNGLYTLMLSNGGETQVLDGNWKVLFALEEDTGYWNIYELQIEKIDF
jgi:hypothetical protein